MAQRLIDANALKEWLVAQIDYYKKYSGYNCNAMASAYGAILERIDNEPTVDAVQVVANDRNKLCPINHGLRCKDIDNCAFLCEWGQCAVKAIAVACADGERR